MTTNDLIKKATSLTRAAGTMAKSNYKTQTVKEAAVYGRLATKESFNKEEIKAQIKLMPKFNVEILNEMANRCNSSLMAVTFWYNAIHTN